MKGEVKTDWSKAAYWQARFESADTPWELGHPSSVLLEAFVQAGVPHSLLGRKILSPGCGKGSDALELVKRGAKVIAIDWSPAAIAEIEKRYSEVACSVSGSLELIAGDLFSVPPQPVDYVAEHTFFCAIDPSDRVKYAQKISEWLPKGGLLVGNFFVVSPEEAKLLPGLSLTQKGEGPPFATTESELRRCFSTHFVPKALRPAMRSEPTRRPGMEWVGVFERR